MPITFNDSADIYDNPLSSTKAQSGPNGQRRAERYTAKDFSVAAERMYGNVGGAGMTYSTAETYVGHLFDSTRMKAQVDGHLGDVPLIEAEARALVNFAHRNFSQSELQQLVRTMSPHMKPLTEMRDAEAIAQVAHAGAKNIAKKHGLADGETLYNAAQTAIGKLVGAGLRRALIDDGAAHDDVVIESLAMLAYSKGWATKPERQSMHFEPPQAA